MSWEAWFTLGVIVLVVGMLVATRRAPAFIIWGGLALLLTFGVIDAEQMLSGLANPGMAAVGVLFAVVVGLRETGAITWIGHRLLGRPHSLLGAQTRVMAPMSAISAFINNTPLVAMMVPVVRDWSRKYRLTPSKLMIPLNHASVLGGTCTLIGTSTNLIVNGLLIAETDHPGMGFFEIAAVGVPCTIAGLVFMVIFGRWLLPDRGTGIGLRDDPRRYTVEMMVDANSPLAGRTIEEAGLRHLPGMYLMEIDRNGQIMPAVAPTEPLREHDRLVFAGVVESVVDLRKVRGLTPATDQVFKLDAPRTQRCLVEAVVSNTCPMVGKTVREGRFRTTYDAVVVAAAREGQRINKKIGDIVLRAGDTLLLEASPSFVDRQRDSRDFYLISEVENSAPPRHERMWVAMLILAAMVGLVTGGVLTILNAAMLAAGLLILTRCCTATQALRGVDWQVLLVIAGAFGLSEAMADTGLAGTIAQSLLGFSGGYPWAALAIVGVLTAIFSNVITNNAAAVLMFPIAMAAAKDLGVDVMPFVVVVMIGASCCFATPIAYQTNMMVYGPGGYRFSDYLWIGAPLCLIVMGVAVGLIPLIWGF